MPRLNSHVLQGREDEAIWQLNHHFGLKAYVTEKMEKNPNKPIRCGLDDAFVSRK